MLMGRPADQISCKSFLFVVAVRSAFMTPDGAGGGMHYFVTLAPGTELPSSSVCAERVRNSSREPRPENFAANHPGRRGVKIDGASAGFNESFASRIDGSFTGTTDQ